MNKEEFIEELKKLGIYLNENQICKLEMYYKLLIEWNEKINLTAITKKEDVYLKHFYDSLTLIKVIDLNKNLNICDIGSGAGFPGLVLKICFPNLDITLIDSQEKRIKFLNIVIKDLDLKGITAIYTRAEEYAKTEREKFDIVVSRAVAKLNILNELCLPLVKTGGYFVAMKANINEEINVSKNSLLKLNSHIEEISSFNLPKENSNRNLIKIKKDKSISDIYPRNFSKISKNPL